MNRLSLVVAAALFASGRAQASDWVPAWTASPQPVWTPDFLFPANLPAGSTDRTVRQVVRMGIGGRSLRVRISNAYGRVPLRVDSVKLARSTGGSGVAREGSVTLTFGGSPSVSVPPGAELVSDAAAMTVRQGDDVAISIHAPAREPIETFHWDGRRTGYVIAGERTSDASLPDAVTTTLRLFVSGIVVDAGRPVSTVVAFGDSITDGAGSTLDAEARWPDFLAARAGSQGIAVANAGISGARLLGDAMGVNALARFDRDVLAEPGVRAVVLMMGINDIAWPGTPFDPHGPPMTFESMTSTYRQIADHAHLSGVRIVGATMTPFAGALPGTPMAASYYSPAKDQLRRRVNDWIRTSGVFDAVVDFDALLRDPHAPDRLLPAYDSGDHLHPGDRGARAMADAVDLNTLLAGETIARAATRRR